MKRSSTKARRQSMNILQHVRRIGRVVVASDLIDAWKPSGVFAGQPSNFKRYQHTSAAEAEVEPFVAVSFVGVDLVTARLCVELRYRAHLDAGAPLSDRIIMCAAIGCYRVRVSADEATLKIA